MRIKNELLDCLKNAKKLMEQADLSQDVDINSFQQQIQSQQLIIPIVGGFSAGKSSLINSFLGDDILPTAITPETALATELHYSDTAYIEAYRTEENFEKFSISELNLIKDNAQNYSFLKIYLPSEKLKAIQPLILVDMPGFDSPINTHNEAILNYLKKGTYFIFLTSIDDGIISRSMLREIKNTYAFGKGYSFCLSKTNLRDEETIRVVRNEISNQLKINFDYDKEIVLLNDNGGENLTRILESIDPEQLFKSIFINELKDQYFSFESRINLAISTLSSTPYEKGKAKCELENTIQDIQREKQKVIDEADFNYSIGYVNEIIRLLNSTLNRNCSLLATYALQNEGTFQNELNSIVRSTILSELKEIVQKISSDCIASMNTKIEAKLPKLSGFNFDKEFVQRLSTSIGNVAMGISQISEQMSKRGNNQLAAAIHLIADVTKIFQPIVGFVIGGVLEAISTIFGSNTIDRKKQDMENALIDQVFPSVQATIREQLNELIPQLRVEAINNISEEYEHKLIQYRQEIEEIIRKEKENKEKNEKIINELKIVKGELNKLAKEVLF